MHECPCHEGNTAIRGNIEKSRFERVHMNSVDLSPLFAPFAIRGCKLPNRFVMPGMRAPVVRQRAAATALGGILSAPRRGWRRAHHHGVLCGGPPFLDADADALRAHHRGDRGRVGSSLRSG